MRKSLASLALCMSLAACGGDDEFIPPVIDAAGDAPEFDAFDAQGSGPDAPPMPDAAEADAFELDAALPVDAAPALSAAAPAPDA